MQNLVYNLLRRTAVAFAAVASFLLLPMPQAHAAAGTVTLSNGQSCTYSAISMGPDGGLTVTCSGGTTPPPPTGAVGTVSLGGAPASIGMNSRLNVPVNRTGGTDAATVHVSIAGGCGPPDTDYTLDASATTFNALVRTPNNTTTCTVTITSVSDTTNSGGSASISGAAVSIVVNTAAAIDCTAAANSTATACQPASNSTGGGGGGSGTPSNCPVLSSSQATALTNKNDGTVGLAMFGGGSYQYPLASGQVGYFRLTPSLTASGSAKIAFSDTTIPPIGSPVVREISINRCPGVIDTSGSLGTGLTNPSGGPMLNTCYVRDSYVNSPFVLEIFQKPGAGGAAATDVKAQQYKVCEAYDTYNTSTSPLYVNVRWSYTACNYGLCGYTGQYNFGSYTP